MEVPYGGIVAELPVSTRLRERNTMVALDSKKEMVALDSKMVRELWTISKPPHKKNKSKKGSSSLPSMINVGRPKCICYLPTSPMRLNDKEKIAGDN